MKNLQLFLFSLIIFIYLIGCGSSGGGSGGLSNNSLPTFPTDNASSNIDDRNDAEIDVPTSSTDTNQVYLSYDDSASTAGVKLTKYYIENDIDVPSFLARPWEFLNFESFNKNETAGLGLFDVSLGVLENDSKESGKKLIDLGVYLAAPILTKEDRPNINLTILVDVSGSMRSLSMVNTSFEVKTKKELVLSGLAQMKNELKEGDLITLISFNTSTSILLESYVFADETSSQYTDAVNSLNFNGGTDLNQGITKAYELATNVYDDQRENRVLLITDAYANTGVTNATTISNQTNINNEKGIFFSGVGVGYDFNELFLDELTEAGKGSYFSLITTDDVGQIFGNRFMSLIKVAAKDVKVKLEYPSELTHISSASEESSANEDEVRSINFTYNSKQYFLERFKTDASTDLTDKKFTFVISYSDPVSLEAKEVSISVNISDLKGKEDSNIKDALSIVFLNSLIKGTKTFDDILWEYENTLKDYTSALLDEYKLLSYKFAGKESLLEDADKF